MANSGWKCIKEVSYKLQGNVWRVKDNHGRQGYFKFSTEDQWYYAGTLIANELIAANLAKKLGFPVAEYEVTTVIGPNGEEVKGIVSIEVSAREVITWNKVSEDIVHFPDKYVNQMDLLSTLIVFDAWIVNVDRATGKNLILYRNDTNEKYNWYLIDHANCLFGSPYKWERASWDSVYWEKIWKFGHVPKGFLSFQSNYEKLSSMIEKIELLTEEDIEDCVTGIPKGVIELSTQNFIKQLLLNRKFKLRKMILAWIKYSGIKEYKLT